MINLRDKWALVTGAGGGIGKVISLALAGQGCNVVLHGRSMERLLALKEHTAKYGVQVICIAQDFAVPRAADQFLETLSKHNLPIDILVNNAGVNLSIDRALRGKSLSFETWTQEEYEITTRINTVVPALLASHLAAQMQKRGFGRIVNLTSSIHGSGDHLIYSVSKGAIDKLTLDLAQILEGSKVAVSSVEPGWCQTHLGGEGATCKAENTVPGILVPICMETGSNGGFFQAQEFAGMSLEDAVAYAHSLMLKAPMHFIK